MTRLYVHAIILILLSISSLQSSELKWAKGGTYLSHQNHYQVFDEINKLVYFNGNRINFIDLNTANLEKVYEGNVRSKAILLSDTSKMLVLEDSYTFSKIKIYDLQNDFVIHNTILQTNEEMVVLNYEFSEKQSSLITYDAYKAKQITFWNSNNGEMTDSIQFDVAEKFLDLKVIDKYDILIIMTNMNVYFYNIITKELIQTVNGNFEGFLSLSNDKEIVCFLRNVSPDLKYDCCLINLVDLSTESIVKVNKFFMPENKRFKIAINTIDKKLYSSGFYRNFMIYDYENNIILDTVNTFINPYFLHYNPLKNSLIAADNLNGITLEYQLDDLSKYRSLVINDDKVAISKVSEDGKVICIVGKEKNSIKVIDCHSGKLINQHNFKNNSHFGKFSIDISSKRNEILFSSNTKFLYKWNYETSKIEVFELYGAINFIKYINYGDTYLIGSDKGGVYHYESLNNRLISGNGIDEHRIHCITETKIERLFKILAVNKNDPLYYDIYQWDINNNKIEKKNFNLQMTPINETSYAEIINGRFLVTEDNEKIYDIDNEKYIYLPELDYSIGNIAITYDSKYIAFSNVSKVSDKRNFCIFELDSFEKKYELNQQKYISYLGAPSWPCGNPGYVKFLNNSYDLISISDNSSVFYWNTNDLITSIPEKYCDNDLVLYPHPAKNKLHIKSNIYGVCNIQISDISGNLITKIENYLIERDTDIGIDISGISNGRYVININNNDSSFSQTFIILK